MKTTAFHAYEVWKSKYRLSTEEVTQLLQLPEGLLEHVESSLGTSENEMKKVWAKVAAFVVSLHDFYLSIGVRTSLGAIIKEAKSAFPQVPRQTLIEIIKEAVYVQYLDMSQIPHEGWSKLDYGRPRDDYAK